MNHVSSLLAHLKEHGNDLGLDTVKYLLSVGPGELMFESCMTYYFLDILAGAWHVAVCVHNGRTV